MTGKLRYLILCVALLVGCHGMQDINDYCAKNDCPPCERDEQCVIVSNACHESAACTHVDTNMGVSMEGCAFEYDVPSHDVCVCDAKGHCRSD